MNTREVLANWWGGLESKQRGLLLAVGAGLIVAVLAWANFYTASPAYVTLFSGLGSQDAAEMVDELERHGADYHLEHAGSSILVPESDVHHLRLMLASQGMPRGGVAGFELMDSTPLGATDFDRRVSLHRALQGELTRTIMQISGVDSARVHLAIPEPSLFIQDTKEPTAVVMIRLRSTLGLDAVQLRGIRHLVAQSVEGLCVTNVTIVDDGGRLLTGDIQYSGGDGGFSSGHLDAQKGFEHDLQQRLQGLLEIVLGQGNVVCQVTAELNFDQTTISRTVFEPAEGESGLVRSVHRLEEAFQGTTYPGEVPGTVPNIPTYPAQGGDGSESSYERTELTENYEINAMFEETVVAPGGVQRLSVAVVANQYLTDAQQVAITETVAAAIGYSEERNDIITVHGMPFDTTLADQMRERLLEEERWREEAARQAQRQNLIMAGAAMLVAFIILVAFIFMRRRPKQQPVDLQPLIDAGVTAETDFSGLTEKRVQEGVVRLAQQDPATVAQLLKSWLAEEW